MWLKTFFCCQKLINNFWAETLADRIGSSHSPSTCN